MAFLVLKISCVILLLTCGSHACSPCIHQQCPRDWIRVGCNCYRYFGVGDARNWHDADLVCRIYGAHLPSIHSRTEEVDLYRLWKRLAKNPTREGTAYWLGLRDTNWEGRFTWSDGTCNDYTNWGCEEPNNADAGEDCVEVQNLGNNDDARMKWNDQSCDQDRYFFCRKPL